MTGIPITNVTNACSTGSTALFHARQLVEYGVAECTLAMGFEVMAPGSIPNTFENTRSPMDKV
jgi:sterol carrier protein 2